MLGGKLGGRQKAIAAAATGADATGVDGDDEPIGAAARRDEVTVE